MRYPILALLAPGPSYGYELKQAFDERFGSVWPAINVGQIYTTLSRLERDGLVVSNEVEQSDRPNKRTYELTGDGSAALESWLVQPSAPKLRDDFFMKLVLSGMTAVEPATLISHQRGHYLQLLRELDDVIEQDDPKTRLLAEGAALRIQADLQWLDLCEQHFSGGGGG